MTDLSGEAETLSTAFKAESEMAESRLDRNS
jgi:hypothetical protein